MVAQWNAGMQQLTVWSSTQIPHLLRSQLAEQLKIGENKIRVIAPEVGGGFGCKLNVYAEEALVAYLAMKLNRPVKWIERRRENLAATTHGRDQIAYVEVAANKDGEVLGAEGQVRVRHGRVPAAAHAGDPRLLRPDDDRVLQNSGARVRAAPGLHQQDVHRRVSRRGPSRSRVHRRAHDGDGRSRNSASTLPTCDARTSFAKEAFPATTAGGLVYDSGDYNLALNKALEMVDYQKMRAEQEAARKNGRYHRNRNRILRRDLRHRTVRRCSRPSSRAADGKAATVRIEPDSQGHRAHRRLAARPGTGNDFRADGRRRVRRRHR